MSYEGFIIGAVSLVIIGVWHPIVVKCEYYIGKKCSAAVFFIVGVSSVCLSFFLENIILSAAAAVFGFSAFWGIKEAFDQEKRVERGWFPKKKHK